MVVQFLLHALCALNYCLPHYEAPSPNPSYTELRTAGDEYGIPDVPIVHPPFGGLEGTLMKTIKGRRIGAFMGVPYAEPPVHELRFKPPQPKSAWEGIRVANKTSPVCLQMDAAQYFYVVGREDCLYLNVYTPKLPANGVNPKLPVIVYIHGGAYLFGSGSDLGPAYLLDQDVILVTLNYRLGVLGFLSTGDEASPGNNGMKDQALAIQWVKDNIEHFGGDVDRITLMGQSAGAASVNLHLMSPLSKHIPFGAIMHSGSAHQSWSLVNATAKNSRTIALSFKCPVEDSHAMVECLRSKNPYFVVYRTLKTFKTFFFPAIPFGPVVEAPSSHAFLTQHPKDAYRDGNVRKVPVIQGLVENEGDLFTFETVVYPGLMNALNRKFFQMAPYVLDYASTTSDPDAVSTQIKDFYFGNNTINFYTRDRISRMLGDRFIISGLQKGMQFHSSIAPTYAYKFSYKGKYSVSHGLSLNRADWGVTHLDDIAYFLNSTLYFKPMTLDDPEFAISQFMTNVWTNFAATGKPTYVNDEAEEVEFWKPVQDPLNMNLIDINEQVKEIKFPFMDRVAFWKSLKLSDDYDFPESLITRSSSSSSGGGNGNSLDILHIRSTNSSELSSSTSSSIVSSSTIVPVVPESSPDSTHSDGSNSV